MNPGDNAFNHTRQSQRAHFRLSLAAPKVIPNADLDREGVRHGIILVVRLGDDTLPPHLGLAALIDIKWSGPGVSGDGGRVLVSW